MSDLQLISDTVAREMARFALPDSRFHLDFTKFIPGFGGSEVAAARLATEPAYQAARHVFVTPDNGLIPFRRRLIAHGKTMVLPSYGLHRGFILIEPANVPEGEELFAAWLDGIDYFGCPVTLAELRGLGCLDLVVTGAAAINLDGVRFGMGHLYLDLEWGIFREIGIVDGETPVAAIVHDIQVVDAALPTDETEVTADIIATPSRTLRCAKRRQPSRLAWDRIDLSTRDAAPFVELRASRC